jgi:hypothetical protein
MVLLPPAIRQHPLESLLAAGLLLALLIGASADPQNSVSNQSVTECAGHSCTAPKPPA